MDQSLLADRRALRRKLGFWRIVAVLLVLGVLLGLYARFAGPWPAAGSLPHIARVEISGMIQDDTELLERLKTIEENDRVKALIVSISSPGGTTYGGERLFKALRAVAAKKPVVSDVRTLAASAGYMVATAGDYIVAGDTSITGSIGVIFQYPQTKPLLDKIGVSLEEIKSAPMKAEPSPFHEPPPEAEAMIRAMVMDSYDWFVDIVADRRKLDRSTVLGLADGRIVTGRQALALKLVDQLGGDPEIRAWLATKGVDEKLEVIGWDAPASGGMFGFSSVAGVALRLLGLDGAIAGQLSGENKLFLDGLVSVWQVGR